jgi:Holliday junction resolvase RusA-like endonuclease
MRTTPGERARLLAMEVKLPPTWGQMRLREDYIATSHQAAIVGCTQFVVPGLPIPKARARKGKNGAWYTPKVTKQYEEAIAATFKAITHGSVRYDGPVSLSIEAVYGDDPELRVRITPLPSGRTKRPDVDNIAKIVMDALNGVAYEDDAQIVELYAVKVEIQRS